MYTHDDLKHWAVPANGYATDDDLADDPYDETMSTHDMACTIVALAQRVDALEKENDHLRRLAAARLETMHDQAVTIMAQRLALGGS